MTKLTSSLFLFFVTVIACQETETHQTEASFSPSFDQVAETDALMSVIQNETSCFYARDYECWKAHYAHVDYAFQAWNKADGTFNAKVGWIALDEQAGKYIRENPVPPGGSSHPKVERRNMKVKFFTNTLAYLSWDQYNSNPEMEAYTHSVDTRIMEKIGGGWKIVNVTSYWDYVNLIPIDSLK